MLPEVVPHGRPGAIARRAEPGLAASVIGEAARAFGACDEEAALHREIVAALAPSLADAAALDLPGEDGVLHRVASIAAAGGMSPPPAGGIAAEVLRAGRSALLARVAPPIAGLSISCVQHWLGIIGAGQTNNGRLGATLL